MNRILRYFPFVTSRTMTVLFFEQRDGGIACTGIAEDSGAHTRVFGTPQHFVSLGDAVKARTVHGGSNRIILMLDASYAATVKSIVSIARENAEAPITEGELDAVLFRALWSFLNRFRPLAAAKLGVSELDLVVANIAVCGVRIGTHKVFNPLDFKGNELVIEFRGTFIRRSTVPSIEQMSAFSKEPIIAVERGAIIAETMQEDAVLVDVGDSVADVYMSHKGETTHIGRCEWGVKNITEKIGAYFGVSHAIVSDVLKRYTKNQISEKVRSAVSGIARKETAVLRELLEDVMKRAHAEKRMQVRFTVHSHGSFPAQLIEDARMHECLMRYDEGGSPAHRVQKQARTALTRPQEEMLALAHYPYIDPQYAFLNQLLHRRVKWLVPHE